MSEPAPEHPGGPHSANANDADRKVGASGGVVMHLADEAAPQDLRLKGSPGGKNYIGPPGPAGGEKDREVVSVDSRLLITRFVDPDAAKRYGYMVYVRCT